ncbi:helix-turn-helix transcriptional regulator [Bacteroides faecium]|uniref:PAS domain-containing protein n=1 Tax=Bacteroides faecium TaxID=2715212 RepID=A0A6H0KUI0_9BACE|nr:LuxR C-terminal-related transcriptional regulator [Bacteroides faecium]QIU97096.1 PAS domain-containing protein [Bacteroides faecium]
MKTTHTTREEMWAKQCLSANDIDYTAWERDKSMLHRLSKISHSCTFVVDVYKCSYTYASSNFVDLLGYDSHKIETLEKQGDYLESRIHPDDRAQLAALQVTLSQFIYSLPLEQRNEYSNIYSFRILNARQQYIRVTSRHQVLEQDRNGKAWLVIGNMDISPDQKHSETVDCTVLNLKNGEFFSPSSLSIPSTNLTHREIEILRLIQKGLLSKEIADKLCISIHTVNIHRQNLLRKLGVQNSIEAIHLGQETGLLG